MSAFHPRPFCQRRAHHLPGPGGDGSPARLPEVAGLPAPEPGRPQRSLGLRAYWLALILMDIRALGPLQADYTLAARGNIASDFRASEISQGDFGEGTRKGPTFKAHPGAQLPPSSARTRASVTREKKSSFGSLRVVRVCRNTPPPSRKFWWYGPPP